MSAACPYRCTGRMARVRGVMAASRRAGSMVQVRGSTSTNTGVAPTALIASAVAMKVLGTVITSSPSPTPMARRISPRASVPLPTPMAWRTPQNSANSASKRSTNGPPEKAVASSTCWMASPISPRMDSYCAFRSTNGTFMSWTSSSMRIRRAGLPATTALGGTSLVTTLPAPTIAPSPTVTPHSRVTLEPIEAPRQTRVGTTLQSSAVCGRPSALTARG